MCQCRSLNYNKGTTLVAGVLIMEETVHRGWAGGDMRISVFPYNFAVNLKLFFLKYSPF